MSRIFQQEEDAQAVLLISEFLSDEACAKFALSAGSLGSISTETLKAFSEVEYRKIIGSFS